jgi:hypothetical protein
MNSVFITRLMEVLKDPDVVEILNYVHKSLIYYYNFYSDSYGFMNFNNFIRFSKDFSLFPDVASKPKLLRFFYALAGIHSQTEVPKSTNTFEEFKAPEQTENELIDEHLFIEALVLIANEVTYREPQPSHTEKICYLMERMSQSDGPLKVRKAQGANRSGEFDILSLLRRKYPQNFAIGETQKSTFSDLIRSS